MRRPRLDEPFADRLAVKPSEIGNLGNRQALPVHIPNVIHVSTSQQSGHLLQTMDLVTVILLRWASTTFLPSLSPATTTGRAAFSRSSPAFT
mgnify:CR=1 FL=1